MKTTVLYGLIVGAGALVGSFTWMPGAANTTRQWMNQPTMELLREQKDHQTVKMAAMKQYDIRTDELAEDCRRLQDRLNSLQAALAGVRASAVSFRQHLQEQIRETEQELEKKQKMLDQATGSDRDILSGLQGQLA